MILSNLSVSVQRDVRRMQLAAKRRRLPRWTEIKKLGDMWFTIYHHGDGNGAAVDPCKDYETALRQALVWVGLAP